MKAEILGALFDLDGTLVDTAPDMAAALARLCEEQGQPTPPYARVRDQVSNGVAALLELAFGSLAPARAQRLRARYLELYAADLCRDTRLFDGIASLLEALGQAAVPWGVVTNKPSALSEPLLAQLGLAAGAACVVSGDSTPRPKPDPAPLLLASRMLGLAPGACLYAGDARRDVTAGRAAGMHTVIAGWGYIARDEDLAVWGADTVIAHPRELRAVLDAAPGAA